MLMTVGPWKPVYLHTYTAHIVDLRFTQTVSESLKDISFKVDLKSSYTPPGNGPNLTAEITLSHPSRPTFSLVSKSAAFNLDGKLSVSFASTSSELELWYPIGYGHQPLYNLTVRIFFPSDETQLLDEQTKRVGFRRSRLVQEPLKDQEGRSFFFEINGTPVFCGGSNWCVLSLTTYTLPLLRPRMIGSTHLFPPTQPRIMICPAPRFPLRIPADSFLTEVTPQRYRDWLELIVQGNQNMVRVWGGGIYESDVFYDICDGALQLLFEPWFFLFPAFDFTVCL